ncbi:hypothetical protein EYF80_043236 [Liparis tanakae]|uniref:Uncharacterized protein n=1 Tax=Liparis tanakae TaxID=230148 RepID=A0A4Z2G201_9TELE|nr:hypothetical protein EYF80_043236 [Liparis tanakae]
MSDLTCEEEEEEEEEEANGRQVGVGAEAQMCVGGLSGSAGTLKMCSSLFLIKNKTDEPREGNKWVYQWVYQWNVHEQIH